MSTSFPPEEQIMNSNTPAGAAKERTWKVGTLTYTKRTLIIAMLWLLGNSMCLMLMENVAPNLTPLILKDHGASNQQIALIMGTLSGLLTIWINPFVSTWSDRHRGPYGRRRPFLLGATPIVALSLATIPLSPLLLKIPAVSQWVGSHTTMATICLIGFCYLIYSVFNSVIMAIFSYYYWDVIPENVLARFQALGTIVSTGAGFLWNFYIFGLADKHMEGVFVGVALVYLIVYMTSVWMVKEGDYPPPSEKAGVGLMHSVGDYFRVCFSDSFYLWIFAATTLFQIGNLSNMYQIFYFRDSLNLDLDTIGKMRAWPALAIVLLAYPIGSLIDRHNPVRLITPSLLFFAATNILAYFFLREKWTLLVCIGLISMGAFFYGACYSIFNVKAFPRENLGQFCSAVQLTNGLVAMAVAVPLGTLFDYINDYSYVFLWSAGFQFVAAALFWKVYLLWKRRAHEQAASSVNAC